LFGDGAGSCIIKESDDPNRGIISTKLHSDGSKYDLITIENNAGNNARGYFVMQGRPVFKCAVEYMADSMEDILSENNMTIDDIDWVIPHQANRRILETLCKMRGFPIEKFIISIQDHANTSSASIPLALNDAINSGKVKKGDILLLTALGAGIVWGSAIVRL
jgi:3-oxoacyl-[acyl-carrier-protein] synthase-3